MELPLKAQSLKSKNLAYGTTFIINTILIAAGVALLNRYETDRRYKQEHKNLDSFKYLRQNIGNKLWDDMKI